MKKKTIIFIIIILIVSLLILCFWFYQKKQLEKIVLDNRSEWDITLFQNSKMSGEYMGKMYDNNYDLDNLSSDVFTSLLVDYYIETDSEFYNEENIRDVLTYQKVISKEELVKAGKKLFGPDYIGNIIPVEYGCGRFLKLSGDNYVIGTNDPDSCGIFGEKFSMYISRIFDYHKSGKDSIIVNLQVAFVDSTINSANIDDVKYSAYSNKKKEQVIQLNYDPQCIFGEKFDDSCYENFSNYQVTLKKASDGKYYFYKIAKM